jgi:hypothetical protein
MAAFPARDPSRHRIMRFFGEIKNNSDARIYGFHDRGFAATKQVRLILAFKQS